MKISVNAEVVDKRKANRLLWVSYFLTVRFEPGVQSQGSQIKEFEVDPDQYYRFDVGSPITISLYRHTDGRYYPGPEQAHAAN